MRLDFELRHASTFRLQFPILDPLLKLFLLSHYILPYVSIECLHLQFCLLEYLLHLVIVGFIEIHLRLMFILPRLQIRLEAVIKRLLVDRPSCCEVHLLDDVLLEHE